MAGESTTPDLVELVRRGYDAIERRDLDSFMGLYALDAVLETRKTAQRFEGRAAIRSYLEDFISTFEQLEAKPDEILDLGHGVVFVVNRFTARLRGSDAELRMLVGQVYEWEEGMILRVTFDTDIDAARAVAERLAEERA